MVYRAKKRGPIRGHLGAFHPFVRNPLAVRQKGDIMNDVGIFIIGCFVTLVLAYSVYLDLKGAKQNEDVGLKGP